MLGQRTTWLFASPDLLGQGMGTPGPALGFGWRRAGHRAHGLRVGAEVGVGPAAPPAGGAEGHPEHEGRGLAERPVPGRPGGTFPAGWTMMGDPVNFQCDRLDDGKSANLSGTRGLLGGNFWKLLILP